jgi:hypothetical protein
MYGLIVQYYALFDQGKISKTIFVADDLPLDHQ